MKKQLVALVVPMLALTLVTGCKQAAQPGTGNSGLSALDPLGLPYNNGLYGYLQTVVYRDEADGGDRYQSQAIFYNTSGDEVSAAGASLNGTAVPYGQNAYYTTSSISFNGTKHVWQITGNSSVPSFTDSVVSPHQLDITSPAYLSDSVSISNGFTVNYTSPSTDSVLVLVEYDPAMSNFLDTTIPFTNYQHVLKWTKNTGSYTFPSGSFSGFPTKGVLNVFVGAMNQSIDTVLGKPMLLRSCTAVSTDLFIKP